MSVATDSRNKNGKLSALVVRESRNRKSKEPVRNELLLAAVLTEPFVSQNNVFQNNTPS